MRGLQVIEITLAVILWVMAFCIDIEHGHTPPSMSIYADFEGGKMRFYDLETMGDEEISDLYRRKMVFGESLTVAQVEVKQGAITQPHTHTNEEVIIVLKGAWRFHMNGREETLRANQMLIIPPGVEHSAEAIEDTVAIDICTPTRIDWLTGEDRSLHEDPDMSLWAV